jgi:hypothetical protein
MKIIKTLMTLGVISLIITTAHASEDDMREMENSRIEAAQLSQLESNVESIDSISNGIQQIVDQIGRDTTDESHVMTGVSQLEEEAIRLNNSAQQLKYSCESSLEGRMIDKASLEILQIKSRIQDIHSVLMKIRKNP